MGSPGGGSMGGLPAGLAGLGGMGGPGTHYSNEQWQIVHRSEAINKYEKRETRTNRRSDKSASK